MRAEKKQDQENMSPVSRTDGVLSPLAEDVLSPPGTEPGRPVYQDNVYALQTTPDGHRVRIPVVLKVYASNFGRYVVLAQDRAVAFREMGYVNLKHCLVKRVIADRSPLTANGNSAATSLCFQIIPRKLEGNSLTFCVDSRTSLDRWMSVLLADQQEDSVNVVGTAHKRFARIPSSRRKSSGSPLLLPALEEGEE